MKMLTAPSIPELAKIMADFDVHAVPVRKIIRVDGSEELLDGPHGFDALKAKVSYPYFEALRLRHLHAKSRTAWLMLIDEEAHVRSDTPPLNVKATALYWANCIPGTTHPILGDVVIVQEGDFR